MPVLSTADLKDLPGRESAGEVAPTIATQVTSERVARQVEDLGPLPAVALEVMDLTQNPDSSARDLQAVISRDAVIAGKVLKMANSAFFSKGRSCQTLQDAATRLGVKTIRNLVMGSCVTGMMGRDLAHYPYEPFGLPKHSLALGIVAGELVRLFSLPAGLRDELFLCGLLHDVGKLTLSGLIASEVAATGQAGIESERRFCGTDHAEVGGLMALHWKLPEHTTAAIKFHHRPALADEEFQRHVAVIHVGDWLLNRQYIGLSEAQEGDASTAVDSAPDDAALAVLGMQQDDLEAFVEQAQGAVEHTLEFCNTAI